MGERSLPATSKYEELEVVSRIKRPTISGRAVSGPYLFFGVVALTTRRRGYECVRDWAQPIVSVHCPTSWVLTFKTRSGVLLASATMQACTGSRAVIGRYMT